MSCNAMGKKHFENIMRKRENVDYQLYRTIPLWTIAYRRLAPPPPHPSNAITTPPPRYLPPQDNPPPQQIPPDKFNPNQP